MITIEKFLGKQVHIPEDLRYYTKQGLWGRLEGREIVFGLSEPALVLIGGINDLNWIAADGDVLERGATVGVAITHKLLYLDAPVGGTIRLNPEVPDNPARIPDSPYGQGWLFAVTPESDPTEAYGSLADATEYLEALKTTEGFKNPEGRVGGTSPICKAVYLSIREQKF